MADEGVACPFDTSPCLKHIKIVMPANTIKLPRSCLNDVPINIAPGKENCRNVQRCTVIILGILILVAAVLGYCWYQSLQ